MKRRRLKKQSAACWRLGCKNPPWARNLCSTHYSEFRRYLSVPMSPRNVERAICEHIHGKADPDCPKCGSPEHYYVKTRARYNCKRCRATFSVTTGTPFLYRKISLKLLLFSKELLDAYKRIGGKAGLPTEMTVLEFARRLGVEWETAKSIMDGWNEIQTGK